MTPSGPASIRVLVTDTTRMGSQLLADALRRDPQFEIVAVCASSHETLTALSQKPDVAILGLNIDDQPLKGLEMCRQMRLSASDCKTILLLESSKKEAVLGAFGAGARGVFCRAESIEALRKCITVVSTGQVWANQVEMRYVLEAFADAAPSRLTDSRGTVLLSKRQQDIVRCITEGLTNREIAARLKLSEHTVKNYIFRIFDRLGVSTRVEMVLYAFSQRDSQKMTGLESQAVSLEELPDIERYRRLAEFETALSTLRLGEMHRDGHEISKDSVAATMWFLIAEKIGAELNGGAHAALTALEPTMEAHETREAHRRADKWLSEHELVPTGDFSPPQSAAPTEAPERRTARRQASRRGARA